MGALSTFTQQKQALRANDIEKCPIHQLKEDLCSQVDDWLQNGDQVIVMGDFNDNVKEPASNGLISMLSNLGLREVILERHSKKRAPRTYAHSTKIIDGIFASPTIVIRKGGYSELTHGASDHRLLWIDLDTDKIFGNIMHKSICPNARRLRYNDPIATKKFMHHLHEYNKQRPMWLYEVDLLDRAVTTTMTKEQEAFYEDIDRHFIQAIKYAEKRCRHIYLGKVQFSKEYKILHARITLWKWAIRRKEGRKINARTMINLQKKAKYKNDSSKLSLIQMKVKLQSAKQEYIDFLPTAPEARISWMEELALEREKKNQTRQESEIKKILHREEVTTATRRIKRMNGTIRNMGLTMITERRDDKVIEITDKEELEATIMRTNKRKFQQCKDTPFYSEPIKTYFDQACTSDNFDKILHGNFNVSCINNRHARLILRKMKRHPLAKDVDIDFNTEKFRKEWLKSKETTSSGISDLNFSILMTICKESYPISKMLASLSAITQRTGYSPNRW